MVVQSQGRAAGTIGGGTLEYQAVSYAMELLQQGRGEYHAYGLAEGSPSALGMVCGGAVDVLFSYIPAETCIIQTLQRIQEVLSARQRLACAAISRHGIELFPCWRLMWCALRTFLG